MTDIHDPETQLRIRCEKLERELKEAQERLSVYRQGRTPEERADFALIHRAAEEIRKRKALSDKG